MQISSPGNIAAAFCAVASLIWIVQLGRHALSRKQALALRDLPADPPDDGWPLLSVVMAARDEEAMIGSAVRSLLGQDYPSLEVIAVNDRSTDRTGAILDELARDDSRLRVVSIDVLPDRWLGKTHAMQSGADAARGSWILFTDGDVIFAPGTLRRAVAWADRERLDHLVALPDAITESLGERIFLVVFVLMLGFKAPLGRIIDRRRREHIGVGAFNLVRAEAFRDIGGFRRVALSVDDDMRLGQALKFAGYRNGVVVGEGDVKVRWQIGFWGSIKGLEKNFFAGLNYRVGLVLPAALVMLGLCIGPTLGLFVGPWWSRVFCGLGVAATVVLTGISRSSSSVRAWHGLTLPIGGLAIVYALLRSVAIAQARGGITWRGRLYPLQDLRNHVKLRDHWMHEVWHSTR
jgi:glycosyltransferase involved in cell wall biosynthesis